jgi:DNA-binding NarL/FixJ family response regulator
MQITSDLIFGASTKSAACSQPRRHRVVVASNVRLVREGVSKSLRGRDDLIVLDGVDLRQKDNAFAEDEKPDIAVIDTHGVDVMIIAADMRLAWPSAKLVAFAVADQQTDVLACAEAGFSGYVPREGGANELYRAIVDAVNGRVRCDPHIASAMFDRLAEFGQSRISATGPTVLTARETEVITLSNQGCSNKEIARRLTISDATVKNHMHNILQKLRVARRGEAAAIMRTEARR